VAGSYVVAVNGGSEDQQWVVYANDENDAIAKVVACTDVPGIALRSRRVADVVQLACKIYYGSQERHGQERTDFLYAINRSRRDGRWLVYAFCHSDAIEKVLWSRPDLRRDELSSTQVGIDAVRVSYEITYNGEKDMPLP